MVELLHSKCCLFIICLCITVLGMCYNYESLTFVKLQLKQNIPTEIWLNSENMLQNRIGGHVDDA